MVPSALNLIKMAVDVSPVRIQEQRILCVDAATHVATATPRGIPNKFKALLTFCSDCSYNLIHESFDRTLSVVPAPETRSI